MAWIHPVVPLSCLQLAVDPLRFRRRRY